MKKILALLLSICFVLTLSACGEKDSKPTDNGTESTPSSSVDGTTSDISSETASSDATSSAASSSSTPATSNTPTTSSTTQNTTSSTSSNTAPNKTLPFYSDFDGGIAMVVSSQGTNGLTAERVLNYISYDIFHSYIYEVGDNVAAFPGRYEISYKGHTFQFIQYTVPESVVFSCAASYFNVNDSFKAELKSSDRYNSQNGTFICTEPIWRTGVDSTVEAYDDLGNGVYNLYGKARVHNHPEGGAGCSDCASADSCVISYTLFKIKIKAKATRGYIIEDFAYIDSIPNNATEMK